MGSLTDTKLTLYTQYIILQYTCYASAYYIRGIRAHTYCILFVFFLCDCCVYILLVSFIWKGVHAFHFRVSKHVTQYMSSYGPG